MKGTTARVTLVAALALVVLAAVAVYSAGGVFGDDPLPKYTDGDTISTEGLPEATLPASIQGHYRPRTVEVEGNDVPFPNELIYQTTDTAAADGSAVSVQRITYPVPPDIGPSSWIDLSQDGHIVATSIEPEHQPYFEPLLAAAVSPATPAPVPVVLINGQEITLPDGLEYSPVMWEGDTPGTVRMVSAIAYVSNGQVSRVYLDAGKVLYVDVKDAHREKFQPILDAIGEPTP